MKLLVAEEGCRCDTYTCQMRVRIRLLDHSSITYAISIGRPPKEVASLILTVVTRTDELFENCEFP